MLCSTKERPSKVKIIRAVSHNTLLSFLVNEHSLHIGLVAMTRGKDHDSFCQGSQLLPLCESRLGHR